MEIIGCSSAIQDIRRLIQQVATTQANVLIIGESGTGKELIARTIHRNSISDKLLFIAVNCAAIPADLLESELFGHEKGAFTGAVSARKGKFELASKGTIFLDEIGDMPLDMQAKLLRVLQEKSFERIGGNLTIKTNMRVISATNRDLKEIVKVDKFREDLFYRLNVFPIVIPPLRERKEDISLLIDYFMNDINSKMGTECNLSNEAKLKLCKYHWPGNVREVSNIIERLCILYPNKKVTEDDLSENIQIDFSARNKISTLDEPIIENKHSIGAEFNLKQHIYNMEKDLITTALEKTNGIVAHAATTLGLRRTTLVEKMKKYGLGKN